MYKIEMSTSGGYSLEAMALKPQEYYSKLAFHTKSGDPIQKGVWSLAAYGNIETFKKEFFLEKIIHLSLGPCGIHQFTIDNDEFTFRLGMSMKEFYHVPEG